MRSRSMNSLPSFFRKKLCRPDDPSKNNDGNEHQSFQITFLLKRKKIHSSIPLKKKIYKMLKPAKALPRTTRPKTPGSG